LHKPVEGCLENNVMIRFQEVHKWFKKLHVLNDVNLHVKQGEVVVICGPSGSGKSTLIRTVNKLEPIDKGKLIVNGMELSDPKLNLNNRSLTPHFPITFNNQ